MTRLMLLVLAVAGVGCAVPKNAGFDDVERMLADRTGTQLHWNRGTLEDAQAAEHVRKILGELLTVDTATEIALLNNPRLQATYERLGVAQAEVVQAGLLRNPRISGHVGFPIGSTTYEWQVSIASEFIDLFLIPLKRRFARAEFRRVKLEVAQEVLDLAAEVRNAFYGVQAAAQILEMRHTVLEAAQASAELAARQHEAGNLSDLDLSTEQALYAQAKLDVARADAEFTLARERLTELLGVWGRDVEWKIAPRLPEIPAAEPALEHLEKFAIEHRFDLQAAREEMASLAAALKIQKGTRIIGGLEAGVSAHQDADGPRTVGPDLSIEIPLFDQKQAAIAKLVSQWREAYQRLQARGLAIRSQVRSARARVLATRDAAEFYRRTIVPLRERIVGLSQQHYNAMLLGVYQLLNAKQNEVNAYREYIEVVRDYWIARSDLEHAVGARLAPTKGEAK